MERTPLDRLLALGEFFVDALTIFAVIAGLVMALQWLTA